MAHRDEVSAAGDGACDGGCGAIDRRGFVGASLMTVLALLEACGDGQIGALAPGTSTPTTTTTGGTTTTTGGTTVANANALIVKLASFPALANVGGAARVDGGSGTPVALVRISATSFSAFSLRCPHERTTVNLQSSGFLCPNHGARFNLQGTWTGGQRTTNLVSLTNVFDAAAGTVAVNR